MDTLLEKAMLNDEQSKRYQEDAEYRDAVDEILALVKSQVHTLKDFLDELKE